MAQYPIADPTDSTLYIAVDNLSTVLSAGIDASVTTIPVNSTTGFPAVGFIVIDQEVIKYTSLDATNFFGATRGFGTSSAASHLLSAPVTAAIVAEHHNASKEEIKAIAADLRNAIKQDLDDSVTPATTATSIKQRLDHVVTQLVALSGKADWKTAPADTLEGLSTELVAIQTDLDDAVTPVAAAADLKVRLDHIATQLKNITGETDWKTTPIESLSSLESSKAEDTAVVKLTSDQSIAGKKTFTGQLIGKGTSTNDNAVTGDIGEYLEAKSSSSTNYPATGIWGDASSLSLSAGDWDITLIVQAIRNTATWTRVWAGVSITIGNSAAGLSPGENRAVDEWVSSATTPENRMQAVTTYRVSLASLTTHYAKIRSDYSVGQSQYVYRFSARRVR